MLTIVAAVSAPPIWSKDLCSYQNTNQLVWDSQFQKALKDYFGELRDEHFSAGELVSSQALDRLGGPPDQLKKIQGGLALATACMAHSCPEHGAVVLRCPAEIVAVAIVRYYQQCVPKPPVDLCELLPTVSMYFKNGTTVMTGREAIEGWISMLHINWGENPAPPVVLEYRLPDGKRIRPPYVIAGRVLLDSEPNKK